MITPRAFASQMNWLALAGYVPITLDILLDYRSGRGTLPSRPIVITFDDGFQDCADYAVPILQDHGFTATFYLVAGLIGKTSRWLLPLHGVELSLMDWKAIQQLEADGFHCAAHSMSHPYLADLSPEACRYELLESRRMLEDNLGHEVRHMAYPFGSFNELVRTIVAETGYRSAASVQIGLSTPDDDPLALHRIPVNGQDSLLDFIWHLNTGRTIRQFLRGRAK